MGERGQILIRDSGVYLYTHWGGDVLKQILQEALKKRWRWNDEEYLTRIIFDVMVGEGQGEETGLGIGTKIHGDLGYPLLIVDVENKKVEEKHFDYVKEEVTKTIKEWTFEEFIEEEFKDE